MLRDLPSACLGSHGGELHSNEEGGRRCRGPVPDRRYSCIARVAFLRLDQAPLEACRSHCHCHCHCHDHCHGAAGERGRHACVEREMPRIFVALFHRQSCVLEERCAGGRLMVRPCRSVSDVVVGLVPDSCTSPNKAKRHTGIRAGWPKKSEVLLTVQLSTSFCTSPSLPSPRPRAACPRRSLPLHRQVPFVPPCNEQRRPHAHLGR
jgi:hypothetical protein